MRSAYKISLWNIEGRTPVDRAWWWQEVNIRVDLKEAVSDDVGWISLSQNRTSGWLFMNMKLNHLFA
jgi:hypothetical protein